MSLVDTIVKYLVSYIILLFITFAELIVVFLVAGVSNPIVVAFIVACFDFLPIVGTGTVIWPWVIIDVLAGNYQRAIILAIGYFVITIVRKILEPRIVGQKVGLGPVMTLMTMYLGLRFFGLIGMLLIPVIFVVIIDMQKNDIIHLYKSDPAEEEPEGSSL